MEREHAFTSTLDGVTVLSPQAFADAVLLPVPSLAVVDCDGTLWSGDAGSGFMRWTIETGLISRDMVDWMDARYRAYLHGEVSEAQICGEMVQVYQGLREDELRRAAREFVARNVVPHIFPEMHSLVKRLHASGCAVWAVSSTNAWVIEEGVRHFAIDPSHVLAAKVRVRQGVITNELIDVPTDEAKAAALNLAGVSEPETVFGNSVHDAAMLRLAQRPFAVNPTAALRELAAAEGWPVFEPRHGTK